MTDKTEEAKGITPAQILAKHPGPWRDVTLVNGIIRVFDANNREVGLLDLLTFSLGVVEASVRKREASEVAS